MKFKAGIALVACGVMFFLGVGVYCVVFGHGNDPLTGHTEALLDLGLWGPIFLGVILIVWDVFDIERKAK